MRVFSALIVSAALAACASPDGAPTQSSAAPGSWPFPVERGSALPPPAPSSTHSAPPEGAGAAGIDFGRWRAADPAVYGPAFQAQVRQRYANQSADQVRADLTANGFACEGGGVNCRIEIMEQSCAIDWYVVADRTQPGLAAGFDRMCLGAR
jgi:hypothetical protein